MINTSQNYDNSDTSIDILIEQRKNKKFKNINILKVKNIDLKQVINKINGDNLIVRIITNKNIEDDEIKEKIEIDKQYHFVREYNNTKKKILFTGDKENKKIKIEINNNNKNYYINISLIKITNIPNSIKQQYTLSLDLEYEEMCHFSCFQKSILCILCHTMCQKCCCNSCCIDKYEKQMDNYLDNL